MKVFIASDLHFEFHRNEKNWLPELPPDADLLILAGDIDVGDEAISSVRTIANALPHTQIVFVAGNHEFYHQNIDKQLDTFRSAFNENEQIHFLENEYFDFKGYRILGCTLWTGFDAYSDFGIEESMGHAGAYLPDFRLIKTKEGIDQEANFTAYHARDRFQQSMRWLEQELTNTEPCKTIVVTHFPPHTQCAHGTIPHDVMSNYFVSNAGHLIDKYQPRLWFYGHNHWNETNKIGQTTLTNNQLGYPQEKGHVGKPYHTQTITI